MTEVIVVGVDGSETARRAAESAAGLATALGAKLHVVTAFNSDRARVLGIAHDQMVFSEEKTPKKSQGKLRSHSDQNNCRSTTSLSAARPPKRSSNKPKRTAR